MQLKPIFISLFCLSLIGCDQVRDKLTNGFDWDRKISSINNNELPPRNTNQNSNIATNPAPITTGKPLDKERVNPPKTDGPKGQSLIVQRPRKTASTISDSATNSSVATADSTDTQALAIPKPVRRSSYKNVSGMSENDW